VKGLLPPALGAVVICLATGAAAASPGGRIVYVMTVASEQLYRTPPGGHVTARVTGNVWPTSDPVVSPDGRTLLYDAAPGDDYDIYARPVRGGTPVDLTPNTPGQDYEGVWSPDGSRIAFVSDRASKNTQLFVMNADGSSVQQLTHDTLPHELPGWSPDGKTILFDTSAKTQGDIYAINGDGANLVQLTSSKRDEWGARWSPDGTWIAFTSEIPEDGDLDGRLWLMHPDGSAAHQIPKLPDDDLSYPTWSRDSTRLTYSDTRGDCGIYSVAIDGRKRRVIVNSCNAGNADVIGLHLTQAPNGTLWSSEAPSSTSDLATIAADGSDPVTLTFSDDFEYSQPAWSPDGRTIAYTSGADDIWAMSATGTDPRDLTPRTPKENDEEAAWSPDGRTIAFATNRGPHEDVEIFLMNRDGSHQRVVPTLAGDNNQPAWSPDGRRLTFSNFPGKGRHASVWVVHRDGTGLRRLGYGESSVWSPTGKTVAFQRQDHVWRMDTTGAHARMLAAGIDPSWSPDGTQIAYARTFGEKGSHGPLGAGPARQEIWVMNADGSGKHRLVVSCDDAEADDPSFPLCALGSPGFNWGA
jgi:Tol biopolymer transport system component